MLPAWQSLNPRQPLVAFHHGVLEVPGAGRVAGGLLFVFQQERAALKKRPPHQARTENGELRKALQRFAQGLLSQLGVDLQGPMIE